MNQFIKVYKTVDIILVAYLLTHGFKYHRTKLRHHKAEFFFDESEELLQAVKDYYSGNDLTSAKAFEQNIRAIQALAYSIKTAEEVD